MQARIHIEKINGPFLFRDKGTPAEYLDGLNRAIEKGLLKLHESGTFDIHAGRRRAVRLSGRRACRTI